MGNRDVFRCIYLIRLLNISIRPIESKAYFLPHEIRNRTLPQNLLTLYGMNLNAAFVFLLLCSNGGDEFEATNSVISKIQNKLNSTKS